MLKYIENADNKHNRNTGEHCSALRIAFIAVKLASIFFFQQNQTLSLFPYFSFFFSRVASCVTITRTTQSNGSSKYMFYKLVYSPVVKMLAFASWVPSFGGHLTSLRNFILFHLLLLCFPFFSLSISFSVSYPQQVLLESSVPHNQMVPVNACSANMGAQASGYDAGHRPCMPGSCCLTKKFIVSFPSFLFFFSSALWASAGLPARRSRGQWNDHYSEVVTAAL